MITDKIAHPNDSRNCERGAIECVSSECTTLPKAFVVADKSPEEKHNDAQKQICFAARFSYRGAQYDLRTPHGKRGLQCVTIARTYGFRFDGFVTPEHVPNKVSAFYPEAVAGEISFTATSASEGTLNGIETANFGGAVYPLTFTGTYTINVPGCTGTLTRTLANDFTGLKQVQCPGFGGAVGEEDGRTCASPS
jgi:hypothetical protein